VVLREGGALIDVSMRPADSSLSQVARSRWCYHDGTIRRMMFQADDELLSRAKRRASERGVSVAQLVRDALEKELGDSGKVPPPVTIIGVGRSARTDLSRVASEDFYEPEPWVSS
jgi:predicted DNA binding CopG/RHH family protein